jgi:hypothetical protein
VSVQLKPGTRFRSTVCATEVVVVRGATEVDLRCGGHPVVPIDDTTDNGAPVAPFDQGNLMGKRYTDEEDSIEVLCTKGGEGSLSIGDALMIVKGAKPLPSSD